MHPQHPSTGYWKQGRAKLRAFCEAIAWKSMQLGPSLTRKPLCCVTFESGRDLLCLFVMNIVRRLPPSSLILGARPFSIQRFDVHIKSSSSYVNTRQGLVECLLNADGCQRTKWPNLEALYLNCLSMQPNSFPLPSPRCLLVPLDESRSSYYYYVLHVPSFRSYFCCRQMKATAPSCPGR